MRCLNAFACVPAETFHAEAACLLLILIKAMLSLLVYLNESNKQNSAHKQTNKVNLLDTFPGKCFLHALCREIANK